MEWELICRSYVVKLGKSIGIGIEVLVFGPVLVLVLTFGHSRVLVLVLSIDLGQMGVLVLVLGIGLSQIGVLVLVLSIGLSQILVLVLVLRYEFWYCWCLLGSGSRRGFCSFLKPKFHLVMIHTYACL